MTEREEMILSRIIELYVETAEPVGSRHLVRRFGLPMSAATVRNVMADLEAKGYLLQPHTSSGRVPTGEAYRTYVSRLRSVDCIEEDKRRLEGIEKAYLRECREVREILNEAVRLLSDVTRLAGVATMPMVEESPVRRIDLVPMAPRAVLLVISRSRGFVETHSLQLARPLPSEILERLCRVFNENFSSASVEEFIDANLSLLYEINERYRRQVEALYLKAARYIYDTMRSEGILLDGLQKILEQPEFSTVDKARRIVEMFLADRRKLVSLVDDSHGRERLTVRIGVGGDELEDLALVADRYKSADGGEGVIGIVGPVRMDYARVIGCVKEVSRRLSRLLCEDGCREE